MTASMATFAFQQATRTNGRPAPGAGHAAARKNFWLRRRVAERIGFTSSSHHAKLRVAQRTSLSTEEVLSLIERGLCVRTGVAPASNREHLAFYSKPDDTVFVAVHDRLFGRLITVLPLDYHRNLAWDVSDADRRLAKALVEQEAMRAQREKDRDRMAREAAATAAAVSSRKVFVVSASYLVGERLKTIVLRKEPCADYISVEDFIRRCPVLDTLNDLAQAKGVEPSSITALFIRHGQKSEPEMFLL